MSFIDRLRQLLGGSDSGASDSVAHGGGTESQGPDGPDPITCMEALERVQEYLDGALDRVSHREVAHHFSVCQRCFPHLRLEEQFRELLSRSHADAHCPTHVRNRVLELLSAEEEKAP